MTPAKPCLLDVNDGSPASSLAQHISEISEETTCARWECEIEYELWALVTNPPKEDVERGISVVTRRDVQELQRLSDLAGGWVVYEPQSGARFVPLAEWLGMYARAGGNRRWDLR